jgi:putative Ca2+/H+ antiporter (TMEM165/GDT1 family)
MWWGFIGLIFILIAIAEIGDKSQLVCINLAARHGREMLIIYGSLAAFSLLNGADVLLGPAFTAWLPETLILVTMAILFSALGIHSLIHSEEGEKDGDTCGES